MSCERIRVRDHCTSAKGRAKIEVKCKPKSRLFDRKAVKAAGSISMVQSHQEADLRLIVRTVIDTLFVVHVQPNAIIGHLKLKIWRQTRRRPNCLKLICAGRLLAPDASSLTDFGILDGAVLHVVWDMTVFASLHLQLSGWCVLSVAGAPR